MKINQIMPTKDKCYKIKNKNTTEIYFTYLAAKNRLKELQQFNKFLLKI